MHNCPFRTKIGLPQEGHAVRRLGVRLKTELQYGQTSIPKLPNTIAFQPRWPIISLAAIGCKHLLGGILLFTERRSGVQHLYVLACDNARQYPFEEHAVDPGMSLNRATIRQADYWNALAHSHDALVMR